LSIALHLIPGILILIGIFFFSQQVFCLILGVHPALGPLVGYLLSILCVLIPVELGVLLFAGKRINGRLSLKNVIKYTEKNPVWQYVVIIIIFSIYAFPLFAFIAPIIELPIIDTFFSWWPPEYNFQNLMQNAACLSRYNGALLLMIPYLLLGCILGPLVEELYFRGYLLPRMENLGKWAPAVNVILFSVYHFFSPWQNPIRIIALLPFMYIVWYKKDIRFS
jgi:membrane protease YdiL (CAAX protease family)